MLKLQTKCEQLQTNLILQQKPENGQLITLEIKPSSQRTDLYS